MFWIEGYPAIEGGHLRSPQRITWDKGKLYGPPDLVRVITRRARQLDGQAVGPPTGPVTNHNHLQNPLSALFILVDIFRVPNTTLHMGGDIPVAPEVPAGAEA